MHSGLNPAWHFWLSTKFSCCLKMKSVENILGLQPLENLYNYSRIYPKMFSTDFIFRQQENLVDDQKCQAGFKPLCNKMLNMITKCSPDSTMNSKFCLCECSNQSDRLFYEGNNKQTRLFFSIIREKSGKNEIRYRIQWTACKD